MVQKREIVLINKSESSPPSKLENLERWAKIVAAIGIPVLLAIIAANVDSALKEREVSQRYVEIAVSILQTPKLEDEPGESKELRKWAVRLLERTSPVSIGDDLRKDFEDGRTSLPTQVLSDIRAQIEEGEYVDVPVSSFVDIAVKSGQVTKDEVKSFLSSALEMLSGDRDYFVDGHRESIQVRGGKVFIHDTGNRSMFRNAQNGVLEVLEAIENEKNVEGVSIKVRGTERFFDINDIPGVGGSAWIGFDLR